MKRTIGYLSILAAGSMLAASCSEDDMTLPVVSMPEAGSATPVYVSCDEVLAETVHTFVLTLDMATSIPVMGSIAVDESYVDVFNSANGTDFLMMPDNIYEIPADDFIIAPGSTESNTMRVNFNGTLFGLEQGHVYLLPIVAVIDETVAEECSTGIPVHYVAVDVDRELIYTPGLRFSSDSDAMRQTLTFGEAIDMTDNTHTFEIRIFPYSWHDGVSYIGTWHGLDRGENNAAFSGCEVRVTSPGRSNIGNRQCDLTLAASGDPVITTGEWHTITITCDGAQTGQSSEVAYRLYYNGELIAEAAPTKRFGPESSQGFQVGYSLDGFTFGNTASSYYFDGLIGEIRIWKDCLTQEEIAGHLRTVENPVADEMYAYWKIDEGQGNVLSDSSGNGRDLIFPDTVEVSWGAELEE